MWDDEKQDAPWQIKWPSRLERLQSVHAKAEGQFHLTQLLYRLVQTMWIKYHLYLEFITAISWFKTLKALYG